MLKYVETINGALRVPETYKEFGDMNEEDIISKAIPNDISKARDGFYISPSDPSIVWANPVEILESLGEEPSDEMVGALATSLVDAYKDQDINLVVITDG